MEKNFTLLDVALLKQPSHKSFDINAVFLSLIVITLAIMTVLLFILIQKKIHELGLAGFFA